MIARWIEKLRNVHFDIKNRSGKISSADCLSRINTKDEQKAIVGAFAMDAEQDNIDFWN